MSRIFFDRPLDTVAMVWQVHRRDGVALGFTTHDRDIWADGLLHRAGPGMVPSAIRRTVDFSDDAAEIEGALSHDAITESDLASGRYDGARVAVGAIDWETGAAEILYRGTIESVGRESGRFTARLRSAKAVLARDTIPRTSPGCRARFCDRGCTLSPARFTHRAIVTEIDRDADRVSFAVADPTRFAEGEVRWVDGPQTGLSATVIAAAGRASCNPPPAPRLDRSNPAADSLLTSFCTVGTGRPVSAASSAALVFAPPQWRDAAHIATTA